MTTTVLLRWTCLLTAALCFQAPALVINGGDAGHTTRPADDPGWSHVGSVRGGYFDPNGVWRAKSSRAGVVYLGEDWFITTYHAWSLDSPTGVVVNATGYTVITNSLVRFTNNAPDMQVNADLAMFRVTQKPNLPPLNITALSPGGLWLPVLFGNRTVIMMGNGNPRTNELSYWDAAWSNTTPSNAVYTGYKFLHDRDGTNVLRWGSNQIDFLPTGGVNSHRTMPDPFGDIWVFQTTYDLNAGPDECQIAPIDSGGGAFYNNSGYWELTGILVTMKQPDGSDPKDVWGIAHGGISYITDLTYYRSQILNTIKPDGWPDLKIVASSAVTYPAHPGASFSIPIITKNQGTAPATNFVTTLYQIPETNTTNDLVVGQTNLAALAAGQSVTNTFSFTAPAVPGVYYLIAKADDGTNIYGTVDGTVYESYENNNQSTYNFRLLDVMPLYTFTTNNETLSITGYTGPGGAVTVPHKINGLPIVDIGINAFAYCTNLTRIIIPDSVTTIGDQAFQSCTALTNVILSTNLTTLGYSGIGAGAFRDCSGLTHITIPASVTHIQNWAFAGCTRLTDVTIENGRIGLGMFSGCTSLTRIIIPDTVTNIGAWAFANCTGLTSLYFKGNPPTIEEPLFDSANRTLYYLPGTAGWPVGTNHWAGLPVAAWLPEILTDDTAFGIQTNQFGFCYTWTGGRVVIVEACTNLTANSWVPLQTNTLQNDEPACFSDPNFTNHPGQFYRIRSVY